MTADAVGGVWRYAVDLCRALVPYGVEVTLAVPGPEPGAAQRRELRALPNVALHVLPGRLIWMRDPWRDVARADDWLAALAARVRPDVVHLNDWGPAAPVAGRPTLVVAHSCVLSWWRAVHGAGAPGSWQRYRAHVARQLGRAHRVVAPSHAMRAALAAEYGGAGRVEVIPNGCAPAEPAAGPREPWVLGVGRLWDEAKNLAALAAAAPALPWPVALAGDARGPDGGAPRTWPGVRRLGRLPPAALGRWMRRAAVFAHPARYEPFGLAVLEAAQAGCALLLGDVPSLRENWDGAAVFVRPDDRNGLRDGLERLIRDDGRRRALARAAARRARAFPIDATARAYARRYRALAARPAPRGAAGEAA